MNSKEALEFIIKTFNELAQKPQDIGLFFKFCEAHGEVKQDLDRLEELEKENQELRKELDVEKWRSIEFWEDFKKIKKFALHFKSDIQEGLKRDYRRGENIVYDDLLNEFGKSFLNDLLKEVLKDE